MRPAFLLDALLVLLFALAAVGVSSAGGTSSQREEVAGQPVNSHTGNEGDDQELMLDENFLRSIRWLTMQDGGQVPAPDLRAVAGTWEELEAWFRSQGVVAFGSEMSMSSAAQAAASFADSVRDLQKTGKLPPSPPGFFRLAGLGETWAEVIEALNDPDRWPGSGTGTSVSFESGKHETE
jgi:hypothetical protein